MNIDNDPAFMWWVSFTLRKRDIILSAVKYRLRKAPNKYGIAIPRTLEEAIKFDLKMSNKGWQDSIDKEKLNIGVYFEILDDDVPTPIGWSKEAGRMIFDINMDFTYKPR
jgi:hypothetical protein